MVSESTKKRTMEKKIQGISKRQSKLPGGSSKQGKLPGGSSKKAAPAPAPRPPDLDKHEDDLECDSLLVSAYHSHDLEIRIQSLTFQGEDFITNSTLKLGHGRKYGLVSSTGSGKSLLIRALAENKLQIPPHMEVSCPIYNPEQSHLSVREYATSCNEEIEKIENLLITQSAGDSEAGKLLSWRHEMLEDSVVEQRAAQVLPGLGFDREMQETTVEKLNDSWHMSLALAKALILNPAVLLLDEPMRDLDLYASIWLCRWLEKLDNKCILIVKSNDVDFLSGFCNNFIDLHNNELKQYEDTYEDYVKSKEVDLSNKSPSFHFLTPENILPPILQLVAAKKEYVPNQLIFDNADMDIDLNSRIALVGVKEAGKTTLLNILAGKENKDGRKCSPYLRIGHFDRLLVEKLELDQSVEEYVIRESHEGKKSQVLEYWLSSNMRRKKTRILTPDQKASLAFACLATKKPHILLMDDPTKFMDFETIESLAMALRTWKGAFLLASNNTKLINDVGCDVWVCGSKEVMKLGGDIMDLRKQIQSQNDKIDLIENPTKARGFYPQFAVVSNTKNVTKFAEVVHPSLLYEEYIDSFKGRYKPNCIPFSEYKLQRAMVSSAPSMGLFDGDMQIQGEIYPSKRYRMTTEAGKLISKSLLDVVHESVSMVECLGDFDGSHVWVSPDGTALLRGVRRKNLCMIQLSRNYKAIHKIISDMCSDGGAIPPDIGHLLDMIKGKPEMSFMFHIHSSFVPISQTGPLFMRMQEHLCRWINDTRLKEKILMAIPYVEFGEWHILFTDNSILEQTYSYCPNKSCTQSQYILPPLQVLPGNLAITPKQLRERQLEEAEKFLLCLRNRVKHRMDYLRRVNIYLAQGSDLAAHARFSLVNCVLQEELERANETENLKLHEFL